MKTTAVILAGGHGTRIRHLFPDLPKPMIEVCKRPFLNWVISYLVAQGLNDIVISCGYMAEVVEKYISEDPHEEASLSMVVEPEPLGTAGGFILAIQALPDADIYVVTNGDSLIMADLAPALMEVSEQVCDGYVVGRRVDDCSRYGSLSRDGNGLLNGFLEKKPGAGLINSGVYIFHKDVLGFFPDKQPMSFEFDVFPELIRRGVRLGVLETDSPFIDIGTPESIKAAESFVNENFIVAGL